MSIFSDQLDKAGTLSDQLLTQRSTPCKVSQDELKHDAATIDFTEDDRAGRVRFMVEDDDTGYLADALCEPETRDLIRQIWAAIPKGRAGFQPRDITGMMAEDAVCHRLIVDLAVRLGASITDYMEEGE